MDERVKATCAIYGCGWNTFPKSVYAPDPKKDDALIALWRKSMPTVRKGHACAHEPIKGARSVYA